VKGWPAAFYAPAVASNLPLADLNKIVQDTAAHEATQDPLFAAMATANNANLPRPGCTAVTADSRDEFVENPLDCCQGQRPCRRRAQRVSAQRWRPCRIAGGRGADQDRQRTTRGHGGRLPF
jgi:hypothetical protein